MMLQRMTQSLWQVPGRAFLLTAFTFFKISFITADFQCLDWVQVPIHSFVLLAVTLINCLVSWVENVSMRRV